jgi:hypothetical protein
MAHDVGPHLIDFQVLDSHILNATGHHALAPLTRDDQHAHDRVPVNPGDPLVLRIELPSTSNWSASSAFPSSTVIAASKRLCSAL